MESESPQSETELIAEARQLIAVLSNNPKFASLPVSAAELQKRLNKFIAARNAVIAMDVAVIQAKAEVEKAFNAVLEAAQRPVKPEAARSGVSPQPILWN